MALPKAHQNINWENYPTITTPLNEQNLNKMDKSIDEIDNRVIELETKKVEKTDALQYFNGFDYDEKTGIITVTRVNGSKIVIDTKLEKIAVNFDYDKVKQKLFIILDDGTKQEVDLSALVTQYEFAESDRVIFNVRLDGTIEADLKKGSITAEYLEPNYLAQITVQAEIASSAATAAETYAEAAKASADAAAESARKAEEVSEVEIATSEKAGIIKPNDIMSVATDGTLNINNFVGATQNTAGKAGLVPAPETEKQNQYLKGDGTWANPPDTKNTSGTTNKTGTKLYLVGATSQAANPQTYSNSNTYIGTDNELYSNNKKVAHQDIMTDEWDNTRTYYPGEYCIYNNSMWKCLVTNINTPPSEGSTWTKTIIANEIKQLNTNLSDLEDDMVQNLLPNNASSQTINGIDFTVNSDGSVTANGTATTTALLDICSIVELLPIIEDGETYTLSGCPTGGSRKTYCIKEKGSGYTADSGEGVTFTVDNKISDNYIVTIRIEAGTTVDNLVFKPMLEKGTVAHPYKPYKDSFATHEYVENYIEDSKKPIIGKSINKYFIFPTSSKTRTFKAYINNLNESNQIRITAFSWIAAEGYQDVVLSFRLTDGNTVELQSSFKIGGSAEITPTITANEQIVTISWDIMRTYIPVVVETYFPRDTSYVMSFT